MKPAFLVGATVIAILGVAAIAFAASGSDGDGETTNNAQPPASETPIPVEPDGGIGNTPGDATPIPVEPDGGIGDTPNEGGGNGSSQDEDKPIPVEPDGGIGDTPDQPVSDKPIPTEPIFTVTPASDQTTLPAGRYAEAAPIDELDVRIAESFPPQYFLNVKAGLPSGCAQQYTHFFERNGNVIEVKVLNSFPEGAPMCTAIYGMYEVNIALGSDFASGETYTVSINDGAADTEFTAQ